MKRLLALTALVLVGGCAMFRSSPMPTAASSWHGNMPAPGLAAPAW